MYVLFRLFRNGKKNRTFRFFVNFYHLNLLEMILNESSCDFCFIILLFQTHPIYNPKSC